MVILFFKIFTIIFLLASLFFALFFLTIFISDVNLCWLIFHSFFSILFISVLILFSKSNFIKWGFILFKCDRFFSFFICEILSELIFITSYLFNFPALFNIILIAKLGGVPFFYFLYFLNGFSFCFFIIRLIFTAINLLSKIWVVLLIVTIPTSLYLTWSYAFLSCLFMVVVINNWSNINKNLIIWSFLFNDLLFFIILNVFSYKIIFLYLFFNTIFQWKILVLLSTDKQLSNLSYLVFFNGNPLFLFNWTKFLIVFVGLINFGLFKIIFLVFISLFFLFYSNFIFKKGEVNSIFLEGVVIFCYFFLLISFYLIFLTFYISLNNSFLLLDSNLLL